MRSPLARASLAVLSACALPATLLAEAPTDIGTLPGFTIARPRDINRHGDIVGQAERAGTEPTQQAALWTRKRGAYVLEALPALPGLLRSDARAFARHRAPVGSSTLVLPDGVLVRAVLWREDPSGERVPVDLEPPPGFTDAQAFDASRRGIIVGEAIHPGERVNGLVQRHAVAWLPRHADGHEVVDLGVPDGFDISSASGVNEVGEVVGTATRQETDGSFTSAVVVWRGLGSRHRHCQPETIVLPSHPELPYNQNPAVSAAGLVVAQADRLGASPTVSRPLLWKRSRRGFAGPFELPVPTGFSDAFATDVNEAGAIVGTALFRQAGLPIAFSSGVLWTWQRKGGFVVQLLPHPEGTPLATASRINRWGDVVGNAPRPLSDTSGGLLWKRATAGHRCSQGHREASR